ncbi:COG1615 family transporter [Candidatus Poribacteria bacterium]|nr:COG1615 family transporter [Candidatus Poribacteria bacterium]MBT5537300.1 COG1615 family transporter [Candidatus Poribacteria bacterium]MBT7099746.1 COG1615 family transporter [Candidatus Poribacteria bacterium]MBT7807348.1 COG1615 family transporter [Candidatus Poribacteria bacterium]
MKAFPVTVSLAANLFLLGLTLWFAGWRLWRGRQDRDRRQTLVGAIVLLVPGGILLMLVWPHAAYLWTETLWYAHFSRDGASAGYDRVMWRVVFGQWTLFWQYAALGAGFIAANVLAARSTCRLAAGREHWAAHSTRAFHRFLLIAGAIVACTLAAVLMRQWEAFVHADAYEHGAGRVRATVRLAPPVVGTPGHEGGVVSWDTDLRRDLATVRGSVATALQAAFADSPNVSIAGDGDTGLKRAPEAPHFTVRAYLLPHEASDGYRLFLELAGGTILERTRASVDRRTSGSRAGGTASVRYAKTEVFYASPDPAGLQEAASGLVAELTLSEHLREGFADPIFHRNIGYYLFAFPKLRWVTLWAKLLLWATLVVVGYQYRYYYYRDTRSMPRAVRGIAVHATLLWGGLLLVGAVRSRVAASALLYATPSVIKSGRVPYGVSYVDLVQIGAYRVYMVALVGLVAVLVANAFLRRRRLWYGVATAWLVAYVAIVWAYPATVYLFQVRPNPFQVERPFLANHIAMTQRAYNLDAIEQNRTVRQLADFDDVVARPEVLRNVQLWDRRVVWERLQQSHTIQPYYEFYPYPDVDRYEIDGRLRQVVIAAREVNPAKLATSDWLTRRARYTHGYGVTVAPVNEAEDPGVPNFWVKGIPLQYPDGDEYAPLHVRRPEVYYGEITKEYVLVDGTEMEVDYPVEGRFQYTRYAGTGGLAVGRRMGVRRLAFASRLKEPWRVAYSRALRPDTRVMLHRNVLERARRLAPFLKFDPDPFLVVGEDSGKLWWIIDLYTTTDHYPYSAPLVPRDADGARIRDLGGPNHDEPDLRRLNYIRNSAVAVVDAYNGDVRFYSTDEDDPLLAAYRSHFPELFSPIETMPDELRSHLRYPDYMLWAQASVYATYHVQDPVIFITGGDAWKLPRELFHSDELQPMMPYYTVMDMPGEGGPEFVSVIPFAPPATTKRLTAWLVAGSDRENYGRLTCYVLSRAEEVDGPEQIENRIDQDTELSGQFTLLGQRGSEVIRGNLLLLPVLTKEGTHALVYAEPVYLRATGEEGESMPELKFVIIVADDKLGSDTTFQGALRAAFRVGEFGIIAGTITDARGDPVSEAVVSVYTEAGDPLPGAAVTDPSGAYRIETIMPGSYGLRIAREQYETVAEDIEVLAGFPLDVSRSLRRGAFASPATRTVADVARSANADLDEYLRATGEGRLVDAASALERLRDDLRTLRRLVDANGSGAPD